MSARPRAAGRFRRSDPLTSVILIFPLFVLYEIGILVVPGAYNGADVITAQILRLLHGQRGLYFALNLGFLAAFIGLVAYLSRRHSFDRRLVWPVVIESTIYALTMGSLIVFVMVDLLHVDPRLQLGPPLRAGAGGSPGLLASIVISLGAGVHEELIFRVVLFGGTTLLLQRVGGVARGWAIVIGVVASSVLFSAAHHVIGGEAFRVGAFVYRVLCGVFFAALFQLRGLAVAVYTHALYDIYVFVLR